jgi:carbon monoxide dehydrogenase subunit G
MKIYCVCLFVCLVQFTGSTAVAEQLQETDIDVKVQIIGESVIVDLSFVVAASRQEVWDVLTDFGHMANFISNLKESKVVSNLGDVLNVYQRGVANYGLINFPFESTREIKLSPLDKIQSHMIKGNVSKMEGTTQLTDEAGLTRVQLHTESVPGVWLPPIAGRSFIMHETRAQFQEIRNEIMRRIKSRDVIQPALK